MHLQVCTPFCLLAYKTQSVIPLVPHPKVNAQPKPMERWRRVNHGLKFAMQGGTQLGPPHRVERLGETFVPFQVFSEYIQGLSTTTYRVSRAWARRALRINISQTE
uniref:SFRICE_018676 n=1 Tax=Spodoptera frugiperda TaxID=7108 RepID=A0A2H1X309_SPOFR